MTKHNLQALIDRPDELTVDQLYLNVEFNHWAEMRDVLVNILPSNLLPDSALNLLHLSGKAKFELKSNRPLAKWCPDNRAIINRLKTALSLILKNFTENESLRVLLNQDDPIVIYFRHKNFGVKMILSGFSPVITIV